MEADDVLALDRAFVEPHFRLRSPQVIAVAEPRDPNDPRELGRAFAVAWIEQASEADCAEILDRRSRGIPPEIDRQLLFYASNSLGVTRIEDDFRKLLREGFWEGLER